MVPFIWIEQEGYGGSLQTVAFVSGRHQQAKRMGSYQTMEVAEVVSFGARKPSADSESQTETGTRGAT